MAIACRYKLEHGTQFCETDCQASGPSGPFRYVRAERPEHVPPPDEKAIDVAILDMNHGWPNLGHDSLVHAVLDTTCDLLDVLKPTGLYVRAISYDVRRSRMIPEGPGGRFSVYVGTGGPGHIDPHKNNGDAFGTQGLAENPSWEPYFFDLLEGIRGDEEAALLAVCHTFGVMCRWSGAAQPELRGAEKGGKSTGILENILTPEAMTHPWFRHFSEELPDHRRLRVVDNRLYDLIPRKQSLPDGILTIGHEVEGIGGPEGNAVTMIEFARDRSGTMPRMFGVNHHPEIVDRGRQRMLLEQKRERGEVTAEWYAERSEILTRTYPDENSDQRLHLTSDYTLLAPLRFHVQRAVRTRAEALGLDVDLHEDRLLEAAGVL